MTVSMWERACLRMVDPRTLLLDQNARTVGEIVEQNPELVASVRTHGVAVPVIACAVEEGQLRVKDGHCRTLAAILAVDVHPSIPVLVTESEDERQWEWLRDQWIANEIRAGFNAADKAKLLEQLSLFGLSEDAIAEQLSTDVGTVAAGLTVRRSATAADAVEKYPMLTMAQAAALAEFEDDAEASAQLARVLEREPEQYDHHVALLRHRKAMQAAVQSKTEELRAAGVTVIDSAHEDGVLPLSRLMRSAQKQTRLTETNHASCPGHAAVVSAGFDAQPRVQFVCREYKARGHIDSAASTSASGPKSEAEKAELRRARVNNEAWRAAMVVRREFLASLLSRRTLPKQLPLKVLLALLHGGRHLTDALSRGSRYTSTLLGLDPDKKRHNAPHPIAVKAKRASGDQVQMMLLAVVLGAFESAYDAKHSVSTWRSPTAEDQLYFGALRDWGYTLSTVEQLVLNPRADADAWPHLAGPPKSGAQIDKTRVRTPEVV